MIRKYPVQAMKKASLWWGPVRGKKTGKEPARSSQGKYSGRSNYTHKGHQERMFCGPRDRKQISEAGPRWAARRKECNEFREVLRDHWPTEVLNQNRNFPFHQWTGSPLFGFPASIDWTLELTVSSSFKEPPATSISKYHSICLKYWCFSSKPKPSVDSKTNLKVFLWNQPGLTILEGVVGRRYGLDRKFYHSRWAREIKKKIVAVYVGLVVPILYSLLS